MLCNLTLQELEETPNDQSTVIFIRNVGLDSLYMKDLTPDEQFKVNESWESNYKSANEPWKEISGKTFWRCGSVSFALENGH